MINTKKPRISPSTLQGILCLVCLDVPLKVIRKWTDSQREQALNWASRLHLRASDNPIKVPPMPDFLEGYEEKGKGQMKKKELNLTEIKAVTEFYPQPKWKMKKKRFSNKELKEMADYIHKRMILMAKKLEDDLDIIYPSMHFNLEAPSKESIFKGILTVS